MYFNIARPDIQKLPVNNSRARFVRVVSDNRIGTVPFVKLLILFLRNQPRLSTTTPYFGSPGESIRRQARVDNGAIALPIQLIALVVFVDALVMGGGCYFVIC